MIYIRLSGRLGNQLFQYAYARFLKEKTGMDIVIDERYVILSGKKENGWENSLKYFNTDYITYDINKSLFRDKTNLVQKSLIAVDTYFQNKYLGDIKKTNNYELKRIQLFDKFGLFFLWQGYYPFNFNRKKNIFLSGNFESSQYFNEIRDVLIEEFKPVYALKKQNSYLYTRICESNSICITIRRGDFFSKDNIFNDLFRVCDNNYYERAIEKMKTLVENPQFIVFSDDIEWCKKNVSFPKNTLFESGKDPVYEKLRLMYSCKHFIISNSTFSWWAQYLSTYKDKIIISPSKWFNSDFESALIDKERWYFINE